MAKSPNIAKGWMTWFIEELRLHHFAPSSSAVVAFGIISEDKTNPDFRYKTSIEPLSHKYWINLKDQREYTFESLVDMMAGKNPIGVCIGFRDTVVINGVFGEEYEKDRNGLTLYFEELTTDAPPLVIWVPDMKAMKGLRYQGDFGWGTFSEHLGDFNTMMKRIGGIAHSGDPDTWEGFDTYDDYLRFATGREDDDG